MTTDTPGMELATLEADGKRFYVELSFAPSVQLVSVARRFVSHFAEIVLADRRLTDRVTVAVHELLENSVKFSTDQVSFVRVELTPGDENASVRVTTRNRAHPDHIRKLSRLIAEMDAAPDPLTFYISLMERTGDDYHDSQLGLGRVFAEAGMKLSCTCEDDNAVVLAELATKGGSHD